MDCLEIFPLVADAAWYPCFKTLSTLSSGLGFEMVRVLGSSTHTHTLSPLLFDLFINALLRLLDSTGISHRVRGVPDWNHQAFADDLSLVVSSTEDANALLNIVSAFQEWSVLKISIKKSLATGALYGKGETERHKSAPAATRKRKPAKQPYRTSAAVLKTTVDLENIHSDSAGEEDSDDEIVQWGDIPLEARWAGLVDLLQVNDCAVFPHHPSYTLNAMVLLAEGTPSL